MPQTQPTALDPDAVNLAKALRQTESGGNFTAQGKSGEYGAYQYTEPTWMKDSSAAGVNVPLKQATPEQQNEVAYKTIKAMKDKGLNVGQIASTWNSGKPDAYLDPNYKGTNSHGVAYDLPAYVKSVATAYHQIKGGGNPGVDPNNPSAVGSQYQPNPSFLSDVGHTLSDTGTGISDVLNKSLSGQINPLSGVLQGAGAVAGGVSGLTNNVLEHIPVVGGVYKGAEGLIGQGAKALAGTPVGQQVVQGAQGFATAHPELAGDIGAAANIAGAIPALKGIGLAKDAIGGGISAALHGGEDAILSTVSPKLTPLKAAKALAQRGTVSKGLLRETQIAPDPKDIQVADAIKQNVPEFDASKPLTHNIVQTQKSIDTLKSSLKADVAVQGAGKIFPIKQLMSGLRSLERPDVIASDTTLNNLYDRLLNRVQGIATKTGGKVENLPDMLSEFDSQVNRQFGNLWKNPNYTPLRAAVSQIREGIKTFAEDNMPNVGLKQRMLTVHHLITAIENMSKKATSGATKEIGTNAIDRFTGRHPVIKGFVKAGTKAAVEGTGIGAAMRIMQ